MPVVSNQRVHDVLKQMGKTERMVSGSDALEAGRRAGATYIVVGYIYRTDPQYVMGAEVSSAANGSVLTSCRVQAVGGEQGIFAGRWAASRASSRQSTRSRRRSSTGS
jgi:hypothetical protein